MGASRHTSNIFKFWIATPRAEKAKSSSEQNENAAQEPVRGDRPECKSLFQASRAFFTRGRPGLVAVERDDAAPDCLVLGRRFEFAGRFRLRSMTAK